MPYDSEKICADSDTNNGDEKSEMCNQECTGFKLFGFQIDLGDQSSIRKTKSLNNLEACNNNNDDNDIIKRSRSLDNLQTFNVENLGVDQSGYMSDGLLHQSSRGYDRKRGKPWTEEEHRSFLLGLEKLGRGAWKGIAAKYVPSRNSTQVASHAQKYFLRLSNKEKKRRRSSVFDIPLNDRTNERQPQSIQCPSSKKSPESSEQVSNTPVAFAKNTSEMKGKTIMPASVTASERPPLSPMKRNIIPEFRNTTYAPRFYGFNQGFAPQTTMPFSWVPVLNVSGLQNSVLVPNFHGGLGNCSAFVPQSSATLQNTQQKGSSQLGSGATAATKNDELNLNIRKLTL